MVPIVTKDQAISKSIADTAASSLEEQIALLKEEGALKAGALKNGKPYSFVILKWTPEIMAAARAFKACPDLTQIRNLGVIPLGHIGVYCPMVYTDVTHQPLSYPSFMLKEGAEIVGIIALGTVVLPKIADSGRTTIESGSVAYFRGSSRIEYLESMGRGILISISGRTNITM